MSESTQDKLIPGETLIYERANGVVYARYRDIPNIPRWIVGGDAEAVNKAQGCLFSYREWQEMMELAVKYPALKKQMQKLITTYYLVKDSE